MLTEERKSIILNAVERDGSASVRELMELLDTSESTIRRDISELDRKGLLIRVHGGAVAKNGPVITADATVAERSALMLEEKRRIARYAAGLIVNEDVVFLDAGTTTGLMLDYLPMQGEHVVYVTDAPQLAIRLSELNQEVYLPGGLMKKETEIVVGADTCRYLGGFHFTKAFFGVNGVRPKEGFTTPERAEALVKETVFRHSRERYVLADSSKFEVISSVTFGDWESARILTDAGVGSVYRAYENVVVV